MPTKTAEYTNESIEKLEGPDKVRKRPGVIFGSDGLEGCEHYVAICDRTEAIKYALSIAKEGDVVLLAGKGHETYQDIMGEKIHYDEREIVKKLLEI